jgi:hypothetical protein
MDNINVIIKPLITEKSTYLQQTRNAYAFKVHRDANKPQIKKAVEQLYNVKVPAAAGTRWPRPAIGKRPSWFWRRIRGLNCSRNCPLSVVSCQLQKPSATDNRDTN